MQLSERLIIYDYSEFSYTGNCCINFYFAYKNIKIKIMYAIKIDHKNKNKNKPKIKRGNIWVKSAYSPYYVKIKDRGVFSTIKDAEFAKTEEWETIMELKK